MEKEKLLSIMQARERAKLESVLERREFAADETLIGQGDRGGTLLFLRSGFENVVRTEFDFEVSVSRVGPGEALGEISLLDRQGNRATARADGRVVADVADSAALTKLLSEDVDFRAALYAGLALVLAGCFRQTTGAFPSFLKNPLEPRKAMIDPLASIDCVSTTLYCDHETEVIQRISRDLGSSSASPEQAARRGASSDQASARENDRQPQRN